VQNGSEGSILLDFLDQFLEDREAGSVRPLGHYVVRFPGHQEVVRREYERLDAAAPSGADETRAAGTALGSAPVASVPSA
jgi:hypothetical protein